MSTVPAPSSAANVGDHPDVVAFVAELRRQETAPKTWQNYRSNLAGFGRWFQGVTDEPFSAAAVTPTDIRDYRRYTIHEAHHTPATVNRRLAALRKFFGWANATGLVAEEPTLAVKGVDSVPRAPKALEKRALDRLIRAGSV